jgi:hypothetical protein
MYPNVCTKNNRDIIAISFNKSKSINLLFQS